MDEFIDAQIRSTLRTPGIPLPRPAGCLIVRKIAPVSVASRLGVSAKDLLAFVDGAPAASLDPRLYLTRAESRSYVFYARSRHEQIEAVVSGIETGVLLAPTVDAIKARFDPAKPDYDALEALWEARDWPTLEALTSASLHAQRAYRRTPVFLFLGAALDEQGRHDEATAIVAEYLHDTARDWTMNFSGIALLYLGLARARSGERDAAASILTDAWRYHPHARIADALERASGLRPQPDPPRWLGKVFPCAYELPRLEAAPEPVSLGAALLRLGAGQLWVVCLLASYRGNGPYDDFMARYDNYARFFGRFLAGLHVITSEPRRQADRAWYYQNEDRARAEGLPFDVLLDADGRIAETVRPTGSPYVLLLDRQQRVVYEGELESVDLWNALASRARPSA